METGEWKGSKVSESLGATGMNNFVCLRRNDIGYGIQSVSCTYIVHGIEWLRNPAVLLNRLYNCFILMLKI